MRHLSRAAFLFLLAAALPSPSAAQSAVAEGETPVFRSDTRLVVLHTTVVDRKGNRITDLGQSAFKVFENGVEQPIKIFRREDIPISLGLIIDNSGSMRNKRGKVETAAVKLVKASNRNDEVFVVNFNDEAFLDQDFTNKISLLEQALARIDSRGGTAMRDAVRMSIDHLKQGAKRDKKVLLVVTDGEDNNSATTLENLVRAAQQSEVLIYAIGLLSEEEKRDARRAKRALDAIVTATGGQAYYPKDASEVDSIADQVARDIRSQYVLAYSPTNPELDGSYRQIKVTVKGPGNPTARTRSGYYATAEATRAPSRKTS
jgi:VWFA-related protein